jgi:hypothetical protein
MLIKAIQFALAISVATLFVWFVVKVLIYPKQKPQDPAPSGPQPTQPNPDVSDGQ